MIESLEQIDRELFLFLNGLHSGWLDPIMVYISGKLEWVPLYLLLLYFLIKNYRKNTLWILLGVVVLITLSDQISVQLFKNGFERYRPCHNLEIRELVHIVNDKCGGTFGFVSSHASNSFALASFIGLFLRKRNYKWVLAALLAWASLVSYSRIYLGVHYPADILGGAVLGILLAIVVYHLVGFVIQKKDLS